MPLRLTRTLEQALSSRHWRRDILLNSQAHRLATLLIETGSLILRGRTPT
jgi:hypothetical protein